MLERYLELQPAIYATLVSNEVNAAKGSEINVLNETDTKSAQAIMKCLSPLKKMTEAICSEKLPTVSAIIPLIQQVQKIMAHNVEDGQTVRSMKEAVLGDIEKRYTSEELWNFLEECTVLDPRLKSKLAPEKLNDTYHRLSVLLSSGDCNVRVKVEGGQETTPVPQQQQPQLPLPPHLPLIPDVDQPPSSSDMPVLEVYTDTDSPEKIQKVGLAAIFDDIVVVREEKGDKSIYERVDEEISKYKMIPQIPIEMDPLVWWRDNCFFYPILANLVKARLCIPATSVPSERVFSTAGDIVTAQRACLGPDLIDMLLFCKKNSVEK